MPFAYYSDSLGTSPQSATYQLNGLGHQNVSPVRAGTFVCLVHFHILLPKEYLSIGAQ